MKKLPETEVPLGSWADKDKVHYSNMFNYLPNPNLLEVAAGGRRATFDNIMQDAHVSSCVQSRKAGLVSYLYEFQGENKEYLEFIKHCFNFEDMDIKDIVSDILEAPLYGYQVLEVYWWLDTLNNQPIIRPDKVLAKPIDWFVFDDFNNLRFKTIEEPLGAVVPNQKFITVKHNPKFTNPYGDPVLSKCLWPMVFKKGGITFWLKFVEKYGMPKFIGKTDSLKDSEEYSSFENMLYGLIQDAAGVMAKDDEIQVLDGTTTVNINIFKDLIYYCNTEISKAILSETLTTEVQDKGTYATGKVHADVRQSVIDADKKLVESAINKLIKWIIELNYSEVTDYPKFIMYPEKDVDKDVADVTATLESNGNFKPTKEYYVNRFGFKEDEFEIIEQPVTAPANKTSPAFSTFAETTNVFDDQLIIDAFGDKAIDIGVSDFKKVASTITNLIDKSSNFEDAKNNLIKILPKLDTKDIENTLTNLLFISDVIGRISVNQEIRNE